MRPSVYFIRQAITRFSIHSIPSATVFEASRTFFTRYIPSLGRSTCMYNCGLNAFDEGPLAPPPRSAKSIGGLMTLPSSASRVVHPSAGRSRAAADAAADDGRRRRQRRRHCDWCSTSFTQTRALRLRLVEHCRGIWDPRLSPSMYVRAATIALFLRLLLILSLSLSLSGSLCHGPQVQPSSS